MDGDSLADRIIANSGKSASEEQFFTDSIYDSLPEVDRFGLQKSNHVDYLVARAIYSCTLSGNKLCMYGNVIMRGTEPLTQSADTIYRLTLINFALKPYQVAMFWERMREVCPRPSRKKFIINDYLSYDTEKGLIEEDNKW